MDEQKPLTLDELDYIEKVKVPEYIGYGWANAAKDLLRVIADDRKRLLSERSDKKTAGVADLPDGSMDGPLGVQTVIRNAGEKTA